jgi:hypothetical protein
MTPDASAMYNDPALKNSIIDEQMAQQNKN